MTTTDIRPDLTGPGSPRKDGWVAVCTMRQLIPERGVAVLVGGHQVALFRVTSTVGEDFVYAVGHRDPFSDANVIARGIVGSVGSGEDQRDTVASPMYKHVFELATGSCLTDPSDRLPVYRTWIAGGVVYVNPQPVDSQPLDSQPVDTGPDT
jgi:nitrite reductase (NADH) small subunit